MCRQPRGWASAGAPRSAEWLILTANAEAQLHRRYCRSAREVYCVACDVGLHCVARFPHLDALVVVFPISSGSNLRAGGAMSPAPVGAGAFAALLLSRARARAACSTGSMASSMASSTLTSAVNNRRLSGYETELEACTTPPALVRAYTCTTCMVEPRRGPGRRRPPLVPPWRWRPCGDPLNPAQQCTGSSEARNARSFDRAGRSSWRQRSSCVERDRAVEEAKEARSARDSALAACAPLRRSRRTRAERAARRVRERTLTLTLP